MSRLLAIIIHAYELKLISLYVRSTKLTRVEITRQQILLGTDKE
jgi:hypothetical protein